MKSALIALEHRLKEEFNHQILYKIGLQIALDVETVMECLGYPTNFKTVQTLYQELPIYSKNDMAIDGNDLQVVLNRKPGKWLGDLMTEIETTILSGELPNEKPIIVEWISTHYTKDA